MDTRTTTAGLTAAARWPRATLPLQSDERLARMVGAGDDRAFAVLYQRYHQQLYRYCRSLLAHDADAQDALQAAFAGALSALRLGRRNAPVRPWLYRIAHNEAVTLLRRRRRHVELGELDAGVGPSAADAAAGRERLAQLVADLGELPERQRSALVMRELNGLSHEEIAVALQSSPGAAKQAIFEARYALQEFEEGRALACEEVCRMISDGDRRALRGRRVRSHLRSCSACAAFAAAIPARRADLQALAPPLAPAAAGGVLAALIGGAGSHHGGGALAGLAGKSAGLAAGTKAAVGITIVAGAGFGLSRALPQAHPQRQAGHSAGAHAPGVRSVAGRTSGRTGATSAPRAAAGAHRAAAGPHRASSHANASAGSHGVGASADDGRGLARGNAGHALARGRTKESPANGRAHAPRTRRTHREHAPTVKATPHTRAPRHTSVRPAKPERSGSERGAPSGARNGAAAPQARGEAVPPSVASPESP
jgi:RNA polymerase sigma factor (sigma-70 family)